MADPSKDGHRSVSRRTLLAGGGAVGLSAALAGCGKAKAKPQFGGGDGGPIDVAVKPINDFSRVTGQTRFGRLTFRGGLVLTSSHDSFGGWSGLVMDTNGRRLLSVSDAGSWFMGDIAYQADKPAAIENARIGPIMTADGNPVSKNRDRDAEAVCLVDGTLDRGTLLIAFERNSRIGRFPIGPDGIGRPSGYLPLPADVRRFDRNRSFESVTMLRAGRYRGATVAFAERYLDPQRRHIGWMWLAGKPEKLLLAAKDGFDVTDVAGLPDGGLLVLERSFSWFSGVGMRLRRVAAREIAPGAVLEGEVLVEADMSYDIDNMEGLGLHVGPRGELVVTLISDDNFNSFLQRTILLQFTLDNDKSARA